MNAPALSLLVGSDALGWADLAGSAGFGERTKGMPGGDGSLSFTLPPDVAAKARNQLQHKARVKLTANGAPDFGGRICSDPFGDVLSPVKDAVTVECSGLWAWADRYGAFAWVWHDTGTSQWSTTGQQFNAEADELIRPEGDEANKFDSDTEGRLFIRADSTAAFSAYARSALNYWLLGGLGGGCEIVRLAVTYKCNLPLLMEGNAQLLAVASTDANHAWAVGYSYDRATGTYTGVILATTNGGATWTAQTSGTTEHLFGVAFSDATHGWAVGNDGTILVTNNGGATWTAQTSGFAGQLLGVTFVDATHGWAVGYNGTILATTNGGGTWTAQGSVGSGYLSAVTFTDATHGWAVGNDGIIRATTNGGGTWTAQTSGTIEHLRAVAFSDNLQGLAVGDNGTIIATTTGGSTWFEPTFGSGSSERLYGAAYPDPSCSLAVGESGTILATTESISVWETQDSPRPGNLTGVTFVDATHGWAVGSSGAIVATTDGGETWTAQDSGTAGPGPWSLWFFSEENPWDKLLYPLQEPPETTTRDTWYATGFDLDPAQPNQCLSIMLQRFSDTPWTRQTPEVISDPWVWVQTVWVICRLGLTGDDTAGFLTDALRDMATREGLATVTRGEDVYSLAEDLQLAVRSMTSIRGGLLEVAGLYSGEIEYWFDLDEAGNDRFNYFERPTVCDPTRNSVWHYGDAAGESVAGLDHDPELCPDWIRITYLSDGVTTIPNGTPRDVWYPATPPTDCSASVRVITEFADRPFTDAHAAALAQRVHARISASKWSGPVPVPFTMTDVAGRERGGWQVRQGDRISVPSLDGADDLYVTEVSWNWTTLTGSATVGYPWEVAGMLGPDVVAPAPFVQPSLPEGPTG